MSESDGPSIPNLGELLQTAQRMQQEMNRIQQELAQKTAEGAAGGGLVVACANGRQQLVSIRIEPDVIDPNEKDMLEDLVVAAVNQALSRSSEMAREELSKATGGLPIKIPGLI